MGAYNSEKSDCIVFCFSAFISYYGVLEQAHCGNLDDEENE